MDKRFTLSSRFVAWMTGSPIMLQVAWLALVGRALEGHWAVAPSAVHLAAAQGSPTEGTVPEPDGGMVDLDSPAVAAQASDTAAGPSRPRVARGRESSCLPPAPREEWPVEA